MDYHTPSPWGTLIGEDKKARPLLQSLYRAIVHHIIYEIQPRTVRSLTPEKLAAFYREVGGDLDALFLNTDSLTISNVFTTLGCVHSLLPDPKDDFAPPQVPALHPRGFERWQTIQLLMEPDEHAEYMQQAVLRLGLLDPETQDSFSDLGPIPREAFPAEQDAETLEWHKNVFLKRIRDDEEREKAAAEEGQKQRGGAAAPGGGGAEDAGEERNVHAEEAEELDMRPERMRRPYSRSHSRHSSGDHTPYGGYSSSYDGRGRSPMPPAAADRAYSRPRHASQYSQRYATPDPPDADDRDRARSRKGSHVQYVFEDDAASVRSVSPSFTHEYAQSAAAHHPARKGRGGRAVSGEHIPSARGRSAEPPYLQNYYNYSANGYVPAAVPRDRYSRSPMPKSRSKSHGEHTHSTPSTESLHNSYYGLPPLAPGYVHFQEVSPSGMLPGVRGGHVPAEYFPTDRDRFPTSSPRPHSHPHHHPRDNNNNNNNAGSGSSSASTAHPRSSDPGVRHSSRHHKRNGSPGAGRYHSTSTDSLLQPYGFSSSNGNPISSSTPNPTSSSSASANPNSQPPPPPLSSSLPSQPSIPSPLTPRDPKSKKKFSQPPPPPAAVAVSDSEDDHYAAAAYYKQQQRHQDHVSSSLRPHHSPSAAHLRGATGHYGSSQTLAQQQQGQAPPPTPQQQQAATYGSSSSSSRRRREREKQREREEERMMKPGAVAGLEISGVGSGVGLGGGGGGRYEEDVVVGMGRFSGGGSMSRNGGWPSSGGGRRSPGDVRGGGGGGGEGPYGLGLAVGASGSRMR